MKDTKGAYRILVWGHDGNRPPGRPRRRWEDNIKMDHQEVRRKGMDWIAPAQIAEACKCGNEYSGSIKCGESTDS
jgi:hypothetical protein